MDRTDAQYETVDPGNAEDHGHAGAAGFLAGVLLGAAVGAGVALLFAPESGTRTRRKLGRRARALRHDAVEGLEDATRRGRRDLARRRRHARATLRRALEDIL